MFISALSCGISMRFSRLGMNIRGLVRAGSHAQFLQWVSILSIFNVQESRRLEHDVAWHLHLVQWLKMLSSSSPEYHTPFKFSSSVGFGFLVLRLLRPCHDFRNIYLVMVFVMQDTSLAFWDLFPFLPFLLLPIALRFFTWWFGG